MQRRSRVDLHIHSTTSDGVLTPSEVVYAALERRLRAIALTDHDSLGGIAEAQAAVAGTELELIPGIEVSTEGSWGDLHFLGYYVDPENPFLRSQLARLQEARLERARKMVRKLARMGMPMAWEKVRALAGGDSVGRLHIGRALFQQGYVNSVQEAFERYIGHGGPAYASRLRLPCGEVIEAIGRAGGVAVLAHPVKSEAVDLIPKLASLGLQGLEVYYPSHSPEEIDQLRDLCRRYGLLATGGSDFHGSGHEEGVPIGGVFVPMACVADLREAVGLPPLQLRQVEGD